MTATTTAPRPARTRTSFLRVGLVLTCAVLVGWVGIRAVATVVNATVTPGPSVFAAYVDVTATPAYPFETPAGPAQSNVILSFIVADPTSGCTPLWGGAYSLDKAASELELDRRISQLRLTGGQIRVSFGGQAGHELASKCTDPAALRDAYQSVVDRYTLSGIDLDLEGASLEDAAGLARRVAAVKAVQEHVSGAGRNLSVWLTLPVAPAGLTDAGMSVVTAMLSAGVDLAGVNGMTMDFGTGTSPAQPLSDIVIQAATALHTQVSGAFERSGSPLSDSAAWGKVGLTPMIGQNDVAAEKFTLTDARVVNAFVRSHGLGQLSMWSLNRDSTCRTPLPSVLTVVQTSCSGIDQGTERFAVVLAADSAFPIASTGPSPSPSGSTASPTTASTAVDNPAVSPFPIWDPLGAYPAGTRAVWHRQVFQARYWSTGFAPDTPVASAQDNPWALLGPVLPGDKPAPLPTLPAGSYPQWGAAQAYVAGTRVQVGLVPYEAKWWSRGQQPGASVAGGSPWILVATG